MNAHNNYLESHFISRTVPFRFRGIDFNFSLSQGLFSSADIDGGTRLLLKVFSRFLDDSTAEGHPPPQKVLDAGCGAGIIGICAAGAIARMSGRGGPQVRCQDRDELARLVTLYNAEKNGVPLSVLEARTEPLLAGPETGLQANGLQTERWDCILTNIPAKTGKPVLENFVRRSVEMLNPGGRVIMVAVNPLADFFREQLNISGAKLLTEENGSGHRVLVYGRNNGSGFYAENTADATADFFERYPFYARTLATYRIADIPVQIKTVHGASGFDAPGGAVMAAAKLVTHLGKKLYPATGTAPLLIHEPGQGFFSCWLLEFLRAYSCPLPRLILSGRNILALEAARHNAAMGIIVPAADLHTGRETLRAAAQGCLYQTIAAFPELLPQSSLPGGADQFTVLWEALPPLLANNGIFLAAFGSGDAERFDRKKPAGYIRMGSVKRKNFRALAYCQV